MNGQKVNYRKTTIGILYILPTLVIYLVFLVYPGIDAFWLSFTRWDGINAIKNFVGLSNYINLFSDRVFRISLANTVFFTLLAVFLITFLGLILATLVQNMPKGKVFFRIGYFVPVIISEVTFGLLWKWMLMPNFGLINGLFNSLSLGKFFPPLLGDSRTALVTLLGIFVMKWAGFAMVIYLANMQNIPNELYEAARVEGASDFKLFLYITLPLLRTATIINLLLMFIWSFRLFDLVYVVTLGAPGYSTYVISLQIYDLAFKFFKMGYASTVSFVLFIITMVVSVFYLKVMRAAS